MKQGAVKDRSKREQERRNLRQLVGTNLVHDIHTDTDTQTQT